MEQTFISMEKKLDECVCPVCKNHHNKLLSSYPGNFLEIKQLFKCNVCALVFGHKIPNKKEVDKYYESGLFYEGIPNKFDQKLLDWHFKVSETRLDVILKNTSNNLNENFRYYSVRYLLIFVPLYPITYHPIAREVNK